MCFLITIADHWLIPAGPLCSADRFSIRINKGIITIIIIIGFHQRTKTLELHSKKQIVPYERTAEEVSFQWHYGHTIGFHLWTNTSKSTP